MYVISDPSCVIREDPISFFEYDEGIIGSSLAKKITDSVESFGLDIEKLLFVSTVHRMPSTFL